MISQNAVTFRTTTQDGIVECTTYAVIVVVIGLLKDALSVFCITLFSKDFRELIFSETEWLSVGV